VSLDSDLGIHRVNCCFVSPDPIGIDWGLLCLKRPRVSPSSRGTTHMSVSAPRLMASLSSQERDRRYAYSKPSMQGFELIHLHK
jgi:hypothetical protein